MIHDRSFSLAGLPLSVRLPGDVGLELALSRLLPPADGVPPSAPSVVVEALGGGKFQLSGEGLLRSFTCHDAVDAACGVAAGLIGAYAREVPGHLCFHAAAIIHDGKAYLLPTTYRTGKSTFCVAWLEAGGKLLTDDAAIVDPQTKLVTSFGIAPRIRTPLLRDGPERLRRYLTPRLLLEGPRLAYVAPEPGSQARPGEAFPLAGWVFLARAQGSATTVSRLDSGESLRRIIWQNFARSMAPSDLLNFIDVMASQYPCLMLEYEDAVEAVPALQQALDAPRQPSASARSRVEASLFEPSAAMALPEEVQVTETAAGLYVADNRNGRIYFLNPSAGVMWRIASTGVGTEEAEAILRTLYPGEVPQKLAADYRKLRDDVMALALLQPSGRPP